MHDIEDACPVERSGTWVRATIERVFRAEHARVAAALIAALRDFEVAEEAMQDAFAVALERWPAEGIPPNPAAWITTTAKRKAIDTRRRERVRADKYVALAAADASAQNGWTDDVQHQSDSS